MSNPFLYLMRGIYFSLNSCNNEPNLRISVRTNCCTSPTLSSLCLDWSNSRQPTRSIILSTLQILPVSSFNNCPNYQISIRLIFNISNILIHRTLGNFNASLTSLLSLSFSLMCRLSCAWYFPQKTHGRFGFLYFSTWKKIILTFMIDCTDKIFLNKMYHYLYIIIIIPLPLFKILKQLK